MFIICRTQLNGLERNEVVAIRPTKERALERAKELAQVDLDQYEPEECAQSLDCWGDTVQTMGDDGVISVYRVCRVDDCETS